jgi:hypothetical protein
MAPCYRSLRQVKKKRRNLKRTHSKAHPEKGGRSLATFTAKEARIYAADIWADPGTEGEAMANSEKAMAEGLKYNIVPNFVYYVDVNEILEGLYEPGDHFWKKEDGPIRVHNSANLTEHVMSEYLAERTKISKSNYRWDESKLGFLASVWGKKKCMPCSKQKAQQHILDKKPHGRNLKKGDKAFETLCPLSARKYETQAHLLLRCEHPIMVYWRKNYFRKCSDIIGKGKDAGPRAFLGKLWKWVGQPIEMGDDSIVSMDNRRVGLMMGIPHKEDLVRAQTNIMVKDAEQKSMHSTMIELWATSIEYAIITWRTRGFLRATPEEIQSWYLKGEVTAEMVKGIFEHQYAATQPKTTRTQSTDRRGSEWE